MNSRDTFARYRERLSALGFRPRRRFGQNFLLDPTLHRWIAEQASAGPADRVLEVGVGLGFLTRELAGRAGAVLGIEIDPRLLRIVREDLPSFPGGGARVELVEGDALAGEHGLHPALAAALAAGPAAPGGSVAVVANLPYAISGPLLAALCTADHPPERIVVLVQKELAQRVTAGPGGGDRSPLGILCQALYRGRLLREVPAQAFRPRPQVASVVLALAADRGAGAWQWPVARRRQFRDFLRALFSTRRRRVGGILARARARAGLAPGPPAPAPCGDQRPESLTAEALVGLFEGGRQPE